MLRRRPHMVPIFARVLAYRQENYRDSSPGPVAAILRACHHANITLDGAHTFCHLSEHDALEVAETDWLSPHNDTGAFMHILRESLRTEQLSELAYRRPCYQGAQNGVDRPATLELYKQLSGLERYKLRTILCGAVNTRSRVARLLDISPICPCCDEGVRETAQHVFLQCKAHHHKRLQEITEEEWSALPMCLKMQGIVPKSDEGLPERFCITPDDKKNLGCTIQHNLLDVWDHRNSLSGAPEPVPRWQPQARNVRPRMV